MTAKRKAPKPAKNQPRNQSNYLIGYYVTLAAILLATLAPTGRVWGLNNLSLLPSLAAWITLGLAAIVPLLIDRFLTEPDTAGKTSGGYWLTATGLSLVMTAGFYYLRGTTHFLGDGALRVSLLPKINPAVRFSDYGMTVIAKSVYTTLASSVAHPAEFSYQLISWVGGLAFLAASMLFAARFRRDLVGRLLMFLGLITGGYMLLFFGYVENYSILGPLMAIVVMLGFWSARTTHGRWLAVIPLAAAALLHVFGVSLIPAVLYLLLYDTSPGRAVGRMPSRTCWGVVAVAAVIGAAAFWYFHTHSMFFQLATIPLIAGRFTVDGYTLFSIKHLLDYANLIVMLCPGILIGLILWFATSRWRVLELPEYRFLLLAVGGCLLTAFIFYPQLGMPRDWDLFAFCGAPLMLLCLVVILDRQWKVPRGAAAAGAVVILNLLILSPRVIIQATPSMAVDQVVGYGKLDPVKYIYIHKLVYEYEHAAGNRSRAAELERLRDRLSPEWRSLQLGAQAQQQQDFAQAIAFFKQAITENAMFGPAYYNVGSCYLSLRQFDSALVWLRIADGLNPINPGILNELGFAYMNLREYDAAEQSWRAMIAIDSSLQVPYLNLSDLYDVTHQDDKQLTILTEIESRFTAPPWVYQRLGDVYLKRGDRARAEQQYRNAITLGIDPAQMQEAFRAFPQLQPVTDSTSAKSP